jgi:hypothetical protein
MAARWFRQIRRQYRCEIHRAAGDRSRDRCAKRRLAQRPGRPGAFAGAAVDLFGVAGRFLPLTAISRLRTPFRSVWPNARAATRLLLSSAER